MIRGDDCREDVISTEAWEGGSGAISFNYLQQHPEGFDPPAQITPLEAAGTTDIWGISGDD